MICLVKMIILDLDGTLLKSEKKVSDESKKYLKKLNPKYGIYAIMGDQDYSNEEALKIEE